MFHNIDKLSRRQVYQQFKSKEKLNQEGKRTTKNSHWNILICYW